ncbi:30S ribosomal protein 3 chloroplastic [Euphorbia peplus]|nr:30S ribosomal protein 3 chloroplastic [Euphorbia peplus]
MLYSPHTSSSSAHPKIISSNSRLKLSTSTTNPILSEEDTPIIKEKLGVVVKPMEKARIVLKVISMENTIGFALDQVIPGLGTIPLTPYYLWGKEDAQEQLKLLLETKPWISRRQMHILLDQAARILNMWPQKG